jgi:hypothetical protein
MLRINSAEGFRVQLLLNRPRFFTAFRMTSRIICDYDTVARAERRISA